MLNDHAFGANQSGGDRLAAAEGRLVDREFTIANLERLELEFAVVDVDAHPLAVLVDRAPGVTVGEEGFAGPGLDRQFLFDAVVAEAGPGEQAAP